MGRNANKTCLEELPSNIINVSNFYIEVKIGYYLFKELIMLIDSAAQIYQNLVDFLEKS